MTVWDGVSTGVLASSPALVFLTLTVLLPHSLFRTAVAPQRRAPQNHATAARCEATATTARTAPWPVDLDHSAPVDRITAEQAHTMWREHAACDTGTCARKDAALTLLVDTSRLVLSLRRWPRWLSPKSRRRTPN